MIYITPKQAAKKIKLPENSHLIGHITWAAFYYTYHKGHHRWRDDPAIGATRKLFTAKSGEKNIYSAFYKIKEKLEYNPLFMSDELVLNEEYFLEAIKEVKASSWTMLSPGTMSSLYELKAFLMNGSWSWSWSIPAGTDNRGAKPPIIRFS